MTIEEQQCLTAAERRAREAENAARSIRGVLLLVADRPENWPGWIKAVHSTLKGTALVPD